MSLTVTELININFILKTSDFSLSVLVKWILSVCSNIHTIRLSGISIGCHNEFARLKKLKKLEIWAEKANDLNKVTLIASRIMTTLLTSSQFFRSCRQVEIFRINVTRLYLSELYKLEPAETMTDMTLCWETCPYISYIESLYFLFLMRWRHLNRLSLIGLVTAKGSYPPFEVLRDFIMEMEHLSYLHIVSHYDNNGQLEMLRDKVNEWILPRRPNFKFVISRKDD
jgi:hypothetical protein